MKQAFTTRRQAPVRHADGPQGFALIISLTLVGFVLLLMLSLSALVSLETHSATQAKANLAARQNAEFALMSALGKLQQYAGPDQRVTATADILEAGTNTAADFLTVNVSADKQHWVGVWNTKDFNSDDTEVTRRGRNVSEKADYESSFVGWLVSGDGTNTELVSMEDAEGDITQYDDDSTTALLVGEGSVRYLNDDPADTTREGVRVPKVAMNASNGFGGNYAYWVSDENVKARLNLTNPYDDDELDASDWMKKRIRQSIALRHGVEKVNEEDSSYNFSDFYTDFSEDSIGRFDSTRDLLAASSTSAQQTKYDTARRAAFHDITPYSSGVLADVKNGGLKKDLSLAFEMSDTDFQKSSLINSDDYNHRLKSRGTVNADYFGNSNKKLGFLFAEDTLQTHDGGASKEPLIFRGPTLQMLRSYYQLYRKVDNGDNAPTVPAQAHRPNMPDGVHVNDTIPAQVHTDTNKEITTDWDNQYSLYVNSNNPSDFVLRSVETQLAPMLLRSTYIFSLLRDPATTDVGLCIDYVGVIYNPYNVNIEFKGFKVLLQSLPLMIKFTKYQDYPTSDGGSASGAINYGYYGFEYFLIQNYGNGFNGVPNSAISDLNNPVWGSFILTADGSKNPSDNARIVMKPGEIRFISLANTSPQASTEIGLPMDFGWNQDGGLLFNKLNLGTQPPWKLGGGAKPAMPYAQPIKLANGERFSVHLKNVYSLNQNRNQQINLNTAYLFNAAGEPVLEDGTTPYVVGSGNKQGIFVDKTGNTDLNLYYVYRTIQGGAISSYLIDENTTNWDTSFDTPQPKQDHILSAYQFNIGASVTNLQETSPLTASMLNDKYTFAFIDIYKKPATTDVTHFPVPFLAQFNARSFGGWSRTLGGYGNDRSGLVNWDIEVDERQGSSDNLIQVAEGTSDGAMWGNGIATFPAGQQRVVLFEVPTTPITSLASLQHADVGVMPDHPTYVIGNSYASPLVPSDNAWSIDTSNGKPTNFADMSYLANEAIWDSYFFSGLNAANATSYTSDSVVSDALKSNIENFVDGTGNGLNPNIVSYTPRGNSRVDAKESLEDVTVGTTPSEDAEQGFDKAAAFMMQQGAFNVNSTSVNAWKALLKGLNAQSVEVTNESGSTITETTLDTALFSRTNLPAGNDGEPWRGYNTLSNAQLNDIASAIVEEVKARGPFVSLADFVNRRLVSKTSAASAQGLKGALQTVLDDTTIKINNEIGLLTNLKSTDTVSNSSFSTPFPYDHMADNTGAGAPGYLMQSDVLTALGPYLTARSDTFVIRAYGEALNPLTNEPIGQAWCEAVVQRFPEYVNPDETEPYKSPVDTSTVNEEYGRQFRIISFRWLTKDEV